jgi:hypothetical protein
MLFTRVDSAKSYLRGITRLARGGQKKRHLSFQLSMSNIVWDNEIRAAFPGPNEPVQQLLPSTLNTITVGRARSHNLSIIPQIKT